MERFNAVLQFRKPLELHLDDRVQSLIEQRNQARKARNFALADQIRDQLYELGYSIEDTKEGVRWKKR